MTSSEKAIVVPKMAMTIHCPTFRSVANSVGTKKHAKQRLRRAEEQLQASAQLLPYIPQRRNSDAGSVGATTKLAPKIAHEWIAPMNSSQSCPALKERNPSIASDWRQTLGGAVQASASSVDIDGGIGRRQRDFSRPLLSLPVAPHYTLDDFGVAYLKCSGSTDPYGALEKPFPPELRWPELQTMNCLMALGGKIIETSKGNDGTIGLGGVLPSQQKPIWLCREEEEDVTEAAIDPEAIIHEVIQPYKYKKPKKEKRKKPAVVVEGDVEDEAMVKNKFAVLKAGTKATRAAEVKTKKKGVQFADDVPTQEEAEKRRRGTGATFSLSPSCTGADQLDPPSLDRCRKILISSFGTVRKAFNALDTKQEGRISLLDLASGLERTNQMSEDDAYHITRVVEMMDMTGTGVVSLTDMIFLLGDDGPQNEEKGDFKFLTTQEKWSKWCDNMDAQTKRDELVHQSVATWQADKELSSQKIIQQEKARGEREVMKLKINQGIHKTKSGLQLVARHIPKNLSKDSVYNYRRESLGIVDKRSMRIKDMLADCKQNRRDLTTMVKDLQGVETESRRADLIEKIAQQRKEQGEQDVGVLRGQILSIDAVNTFSEDMLALEEQVARNLARSLGMPIPDVESIQAQYQVYGDKGRGISREDLPKMLISLVGDKPEYHQESYLNNLWSTIDRDHSGRITLDEYIIWHWSTIRSPPRLSSKATVKAAAPK